MESDVSADFTKMEKELYRSVIRFLLLKGKSRSEIKERLDAVYGDSSLLLRLRPLKIDLTNFNVVARRFFDEPRPGAPKTATTEDYVKKSTISYWQTAD